MKQTNPQMKYREIAAAICQMHKKMDAGQRQMLIQLRQAQEKILEQRQKELDEEIEEEQEIEEVEELEEQDDFESWSKKKREVFQQAFRLNE